RDARGAHGLARPAAQTLVEVLHHVVAGSDAAFGEAAHQVEAPARRIGLDLERAVRGTRGQTKAAVDAGVQIPPSRRVFAVEPGERSGRVRGAHDRRIAPRRPAFSFPSRPRIRWTPWFTSSWHSP